MALLLVATAVAGREIWLRQQGYSISYDDFENLWADKRGRVYQPTDKATVFIGSSRIKFDLDVPTWEQLTGTEAVQLAIEGTSPRRLLTDLAEDPEFKGRLVVDVTEMLFFSALPMFDLQANKGIAFYKTYSPSQKVSFKVHSLLESGLVMLDEEYFSLNAMLNKTPVRNRPGVYPGLDFPWEFSKKYFTRQSYMDDRFLADSNLQNKVKGIWAAIGKSVQEPPPVGARLDSILLAVKTDVDQIRARGGQVIFVRTPSDGPFWEGEQMGFPREKYWDRILAVTQAPGIHFQDHEAIAHFQCPEFSHLSPQDAIVFTRHLVQLLQQQGWSFPQTVAAR